MPFQPNLMQGNFPMQQFYYEFLNTDNRPYYYNPMTMSCQQEKPPQGAVVYPGNMYGAPYNFGMSMSMPMPMRMNPMNIPQNINDLSGSNNIKKQGPSGSNLFIFHLPNDWSNYLYYILI